MDMNRHVWAWALEGLGSLVMDMAPGLHMAVAMEVEGALGVWQVAW